VVLSFVWFRKYFIGSAMQNRVGTVKARVNERTCYFSRVFRYG